MEKTQTEARLRAMVRGRLDEGTMTNKLLAYRSGLSTSVIWNFMKAKRGLSLRSLAALMAALDVDAELLPSPGAGTRALVFRRRAARLPARYLTKRRSE